MRDTDRNYEDLREVIDRVFISMPLKKMDRAMLAFIGEHRFNLEVEMDHYALDRMSAEDIAALAGRLRSMGISMTVHAPFHEIFPGAPDPLVRGAAVQRLDA